MGSSAVFSQSSIPPHIFNKALSTLHNKTGFTRVWNGFLCPHYIQFYQRVSPETFRRVGFKRLGFIEHTCGFIADVCYYEFTTNSSPPPPPL